MATVSNRERTANVATLTTSAAHGFSVDNYVTVTSVAAGYNGDHIRVLAVPTTTTFTFESIDDDEASTAATGTAVLGVSLTVAEVTALTGKTVTAAVIDLASNRITTDTKRSPTQHRDDRLIPKTDVQAAWAIVASRLSTVLAGAGDEGIVSEAQDGYSYSLDPKAAGLFDGEPARLLVLDVATALHVRPGMTVYR